MKGIYGRNNLPFSLLIRLFTWSRWSHCGVIIDDHVYESTFLKGVIKTPIKEFISRYSSYEICEVPCTEGWEDRAKSQLGKPYDRLALFGITLRTGWAIDDAWTCSEYKAFVSGMFRHDRINRVTPEDIYKISKEVK